MSLKDRFTQILSSFVSQDQDEYKSGKPSFTTAGIRRALDECVSKATATATATSTTVPVAKGISITDASTASTTSATVTATAAALPSSASHSSTTSSSAANRPTSTATAATAPTATSTQSKRFELIQILLQEIVRPPFSKDRHKDVTPAGRKAINTYRPPVPYDSDEIRLAKPWKDGEKWTVDVFEWCLEGLNMSSVEPLWPLLIPPVLSTVDDVDTAWRIRGCVLLQKLLQITPSSLLQRTGIGRVFESALVPYLQHLPPLTEESEAVRLLSVVYPTLIELTHKIFPQSVSPLHTDTDNKVKLLDRILRQNILGGLKSVGDSAAVSILLLDQMSIFVTELQIESVKHLKLIIPMLEHRLSGPFATASPKYFRSALNALKTLQLNTWPRVPYYRMQIISALSVAWCRMLDETAGDATKRQGIKEEIRENTRILKAILHAAKEGCEECEQILNSDEKLSELAGVWSTGSTNNFAPAQIP